MSDAQKSPAQNAIDINLKKAFAQIEAEAIPDRFTDLLNQLRAQTAEPVDDAGKVS